MICQPVRCFNGLTCRTKWLWVFIPISDEKLNRCKYVICPVSPLRAKLSEVKRRLPVVTGTMASLPGHCIQSSVRVTLTGTRTSAMGLPVDQAVPVA
ncbi:hypothetical protein GA303_07730 [Escherichia coli]|nr:hypothetical protein [Escherichia coli]